MVEQEYVPERGDIVWLSSTPHAGQEQAGHRPTLVISSRSYNERSRLAICCPITSRVKDYPYEVALPKSGTVTGVVLVDQIKSLDWKARNARLATRSKPRTLAEVIGKLSTLIFPPLSLRDAIT